MIDEILPGTVVAVHTRDDACDATLRPEEEAVVGRAVEKRRREFVTGRACARRALDRLGIAPQAVPAGPLGEPRWPDGVVGSITHCDGYRACAVAHAHDLVTIGIDAEPNQPLPDPALTRDIATHAPERAQLRELSRSSPGICWDRLLFSAKESVYKAWFPLTSRWLGFEDAVLRIDRHQRTFVAELLVPGPLLAGREVTCLHGRWLARDRLLLTAIALRHVDAPAVRSRPTTTSATAATWWSR